MPLLEPEFYLNGASAADIAAEIAAGADINERTQDGSTALHLAVYYQGTPEAISALIDGGLDVNAVSTDGTTPLHDAASKGHCRALEILLVHGADIKARRPNGARALDWAYKYGTEEAAELLRTYNKP